MIRCNDEPKDEVKRSDKIIVYFLGVYFSYRLSLQWENVTLGTI